MNKKITDEEIEVEEDCVQPSITCTSSVSHKLDKKRMWIIVVSSLVLLVAVAVVILKVLAANNTNVDSTDFNCTLMNNTKKPSGERLSDIVIPEESNSEEMKALAIQLYGYGNYYLKHDSKVAFAIQTKSEVLGTPTCGYRYYVKNDNEFWNGDFFYVGKGSSATIDSIMKAASKESTQYAYRKYYNTTLNIGYEQKSKEIALRENENGSVVFGTNWENLYFDNEAKIPKEFEQSEEVCEYCSYVYELDTIKTADIKYNTEYGYYTITLSLDCSLDKTLGDSLQYLVAGAGDPNARYTDITQTIELWDNGRFKKVYSYDQWHAGKAYGVLKIDAANDYKTSFYYDDYSLNIRNYQYATEFVDIVKSRVSATA